MMSIQKISIKTFVGAILVSLGGITVLLSVLATFQFRDAALQSQAQTLSRVIEVSVQEITKQMHHNGIELGADTQKSSEFRKAFESYIKDNSDKESYDQLISLLNSQFHQHFVTIGTLNLRKLRVYDTSLNYLTESSEGDTGLSKRLPAFLLEQARSRTGAERLKPLGGYWNSTTGATYSVLVPVGGLQLSGYLEVLLDPSYNLQAVSRMMQTPISITDQNEKQLFQGKQWDEYLAGETLHVPYSLMTDGGNSKLLEITALENVSELYSNIRNTQLVTISSFVILITVGMFVAFCVLQRYLFNPLKGLMGSMNRCAEGDLSIQVDTAGLKELSVLSKALNTLVENLRHQVETIQDNAGKVADSADNLSSVTQNTMQAMRQQQQETEQLATAIDEMTATAQEVARNASNASQGANEANRETQLGKTIVSQTMDSIEILAGEVESAADVIRKLEKDSEDIGKVLDVIKSIAEQTNLLALNAAIEAARAGEQGRGFAVVADEVRTLASRTQQSTQEIQQMIEKLQAGSQAAVAVMETGTARAKDSVQHAAKGGASLDKIGDAVASINDMNHQIATAAEEQTNVANEINKSVAGITAATEQTSSGTQETAANCEILAGLADTLRQTVSKFKV